MKHEQRSDRGLRRTLRGIPEWNVAVFALLLNFPWEVLQVPLFTGMADAPHVQVIEGCLQATLGDMVIMLIAYESVSFAAHGRLWISTSSGRQLALFTAIGVVIAAAIEWLATRGQWFQSWTYSLRLPVVPGVDIGLTPLAQWIVLPLVVAWFVRRQLAGGASCHDGWPQS